MSIKLNIDGDQGLKKAFMRGETYYHNTGKALKLFPFDGRAKCDLYRSDFRTFHGVVGESLRIRSSKKIDKDFTSDKEATFNTKLKSYILKKALDTVRTDNPEELKDTIINLFFGDNGELIKFSGKVLPYMNYSHEHLALNEMAFFVADILLEEMDLDDVIQPNDSKDNLFYQLIVDCLPKHQSHDYNAKRTKYFNAITEINELFKRDYNLLKKDSKVFLEEIENLFKYYYFFYMTQLSKRLSHFGELNTIQPIFFTMDWESLSGSRLSYQFGWDVIKSEMDSLFAHANTIELLNFLELDDAIIGDYSKLTQIASELNPENYQNLLNRIHEIIAFYEEANSGDIKKLGEEKLSERIENSYHPEDTELVMVIKRLYYTILFVLENTSRNKIRKQYSEWLLEFCKVNFTKNRGRLGTTISLTQEMLLFLVKLCVGEADKIRLNSLWAELEDRGLKFDEVSKTVIIRLFERINLLEKKSDSGDAQYVKSII